jgi:maleate isomerase
MLTPSSNTVLEPMITRMAAGLPDVSLHFSRFRVTEIALSDRALAQFEDEPMLQAADLIADARVSNICWNGTSAGWLGFDRDRRLCESIEARTGITATSSVLALHDLLSRQGHRRIAFVTPYTDDVQARIAATFASEGYECVAHRNARITVNYEFAMLEAADVAQMAKEVSEVQPEAIVVFCTNMWGGLIAEDLEKALGVPVIDTVATAFWGALAKTGGEPARVRGFGSLFGW